MILHVGAEMCNWAVKFIKNVNHDRMRYGRNKVTVVFAVSGEYVALNNVK